MKSSLTYKDAGVNIDTASEFIRRIKPFVKKTDRKEVLSTLGHYAGLFDLSQIGYKEPVLVASTDGVGTKLKLALDWNNLTGLGQDLVAMSANDILCVGAQPLFFLDYYATGQLNLKQSVILLKGIAQACRKINCTLLGGETAEMPSLYKNGDFDLGGFLAGLVEKSEICDGRFIQPGDVVIGLASDGFHSNGYSLVRRIIEKKKLSPKKIYKPLSQPLDQLLLKPTRLYVNTILELKRLFPLHGIAHITGGGLLENLPRLFPKKCRAVLKKESWPLPPLFRLFQEWGHIEDREMHRVFNCGIGLMLVVPAHAATDIMRELQKRGERSWIIGHIEKRGKGQPILHII